MILKELLASTPVYAIVGYRNIDIKSIVLSPEDAQPGSLYIYAHLEEGDEPSYGEAIKRAVDKGAVAVCIGLEDEILPYHVTFIKTYNVKRFISAVSRNFFHNPSQEMRLVAVTGSHGKTTIGKMVQSVLKAANIRGMILGSSHCYIGDDFYPIKKGGFNSLVINQFMRKALKENIKWGLIECSYTSIIDELLRHLWFNSIIYTDLYTYFQNQQMDFHYLEIRKTLIDCLKFTKSPIILNMDDYYSDQLIKGISITYGVYQRSDVNAYHIELSPEGSRFILITPEDVRQIKMKVSGIHNVYNALAVFAWGLSEGFHIDDIQKGIESFEGSMEEDPSPSVKGRVHVYCDNICEPERLDKIFNNLKGLEKGKIATVLCVGESKTVEEYQAIGSIVDRYSDYCILTSDYSSHSRPVDRTSEIEQLMATTAVVHEMDHYKALQAAVSLVKEGGCVLIFSPTRREEERLTSSLTKKR